MPICGYLPDLSTLKAGAHHSNLGLGPRLLSGLYAGPLRALQQPEAEKSFVFRKNNYFH